MYRTYGIIIAVLAESKGVFAYPMWQIPLFKEMRDGDVSGSKLQQEAWRVKKERSGKRGEERAGNW